MAELKWNVNKVSLRKVFALLLAMCVCISSMGMDASAAGMGNVEKEAVTSPTAPTSPTEPTSPTDVVKSITLNPSKTSVEVGKTVTLKATTDPANAKVTWKSENPAIASVDQNGVVTGVKEGTAKITATAGKVSAVCLVTVTKKPEEQKPASAVTKVTLNPTSLTMKVGEEKTITPKVEVSQGTGTPDKNVTWASSDPTVAAVAGGKVTAKKAGKATITATANNGKQGTCTVTVNPAPNPTTNVAVESITLSRSSVSINKGKTYTLKATINPSSATDQTLNWTSSNRKIATVENGKVKAVAKGTATITVTSKNGKKATCKVTVKVPAKSVSVSTTKLYIAKGKKASFRAAAGPADTTDSIQVKASNKNVTVKLNKKTGEVTVTAKKAGTAKITVSAGSKKKTVNVTVAKKATKAKSVKLNKKKATLNIGKTLDLKATMNPSKSTDTLKWTTSNKKVAMVDKFGRVTARKQGTATITVKTSSGKKATCKITVPSGVKLKKTSATIKLRKSTKIQIKSTVVKGDKVKSYKSSNKKIAKVDKNGKVTGVKKGKATITVTMKSGSTATFKVTVK